MTPQAESTSKTNSVISDFIASVVVFLVALPLCMGIAIASGAPASVGIITGVVGGLVVSSLSGSPLQVSGPAAGLVVIVTEIAKDHGFETLGLVLIVAGIFQFASGCFGLGQWFRAVPPSVIHGMLSGIGLLLIASQFQIMFDKVPKSSGMANLVAMPETVFQTWTSGGMTPSAMAALLGTATIFLVIIWDKFSQRVKFLKQIPGSLVGIIAATIACVSLDLPIKHVEIPNNLFEALHFPTFSKFAAFKSVELLVDALAVAFIASAETMLTASALDKMTTISRTNYDKELRAQGIGNFVSGFLGLLPISGVIARSGVNVKAGAKSRLSAILHGVWLILFVVFFPAVLLMVPIASLAALLVLTGYKLFLSKEAQELKNFGKAEVAIYTITLASIVLFDLLTGVIVGVVLSVAKLLYVFSHLSVRTEQAESKVMVLHLSGAATFLSLPKLAQTLESIAPDTELHVHLEELEYIDHACLDLLVNWEKQHTAGGGLLSIDWGLLGDRFREGKRRAQASG